MRNIEAGLQEIIKNSLPEAVGVELKKRLIEADEMQQELLVNAAELKRNKTRIEQFELLALDKNKLEHFELDLENKRKVIEEDNRNIIVKDLQYQLNAEKRVTAAYDSILKGLVRNTEFKSAAFGSKTLMNNGASLHAPYSDTSTTSAE